jgi:hypothetical protein
MAKKLTFTRKPAKKKAAKKKRDRLDFPFGANVAGEKRGGKGGGS